MNACSKKFLILLALAAIAPSAYAREGGTPIRECIYDYPMITERECRIFRLKMLKAKSNTERAAAEQELRTTLDARVKQQGISWTWPAFEKK